jgi:hypothetical protein
LLSEAGRQTREVLLPLLCPFVEGGIGAKQKQRSKTMSHER